MISIHALLAESDRNTLQSFANGSNFYPRSPCGERPKIFYKGDTQKYFYPRSPCGERRVSTTILAWNPVFLSTLSLRRATTLQRVARLFWNNFYPRSPCGERHCARLFRPFQHPISIHALLAESDAHHYTYKRFNALFLSTLSLRRATPITTHISALMLYFYPRSPCGERLKDKTIAASICIISIHALLAESDATRCKVLQMA